MYDTATIELLGIIEYTSRIIGETDDLRAHEIA